MRRLDKQLLMTKQSLRAVVEAGYHRWCYLVEHAICGSEEELTDYPLYEKGTGHFNLLNELTSLRSPIMLIITERPLLVP